MFTYITSQKNKAVLYLRHWLLMSWTCPSTDLTQQIRDFGTLLLVPFYNSDFSLIWGSRPSVWWAIQISCQPPPSTGQDAHPSVQEKEVQQRGQSLGRGEVFFLISNTHMNVDWIPLASPDSFAPSWSIGFVWGSLLIVSASGPLVLALRLAASFLVVFNFFPL